MTVVPAQAAGVELTAASLVSVVLVGLLLNVHMRRFYVSVQSRPQTRPARGPVR